MTGNRTPTLNELSAISREEWEVLCGGLLAIIENVQRVEDGQGKGNGLDGWKRVNGNIEGYQYKRYDRAFGDSQAQKLKKNITLASTRSPIEFGAPLTKLTVVMNIDLEPNHKGSESSLTLFNRVHKWAKEEFDIDIEPKGLGWVYTHLLLHKELKPELFVDLSMQIDTKFKELDIKIDGFNGMLVSMFESFQKNALNNQEPSSVIYTLISEAKVHFKRGVQYQAQEEYILSLRSLQDAQRLAQAAPKEQELNIQILSLICGINCTIGNLSEALHYCHLTEAALSSIEKKSSTTLEARGNIAFVFLTLQNIREAEAIFDELIIEFESISDLDNLANTIMHKLNIVISRYNKEEVLIWIENLDVVIKNIIKEAKSPKLGDILIRAFGTLGNSWLSIGSDEYGEIEQYALSQAEKYYKNSFEQASKYSYRMAMAMSSFSLANCLWHQKKLNEAKRAYQEVIEKFGAQYSKLCADSLYNLALISDELGNTADSLERMLKASNKYSEIGDKASMQQAQSWINKTLKK